MTARGFTLIELLVALVVFVVLAAFATQSLANILQTRTKAEVTKSVRQEADYAVSVLERHLRGARSLSCPTLTSVTYVDPDGKPGSFSCVNPGADNAHIASGSARLTTTGVLLTTCTFVCPNPSQVDFSFSLRQARASSDPREKSEISVSGTVTLRNK